MEYSKPTLTVIRKRGAPIAANFSPPPAQTGKASAPRESVNEQPIGQTTGFEPQVKVVKPTRSSKVHDRVE